MGKNDILTKVLAVAGTILVLFPVAAPVIFSMVRLFRAGMFRFDWLMPAELFLSALVGGVLLIWAALRGRAYLRLIGWGFGIAAYLLVAGQALAVVTGLASGEIEPTALWMSVVAATLAVYTLGLIAMGVGGILLLVNLFKSPQIKAT